MFPKLWFSMCFFIFKWNSSCGSCTTGTVAIQRWHNGLKSWKAVNHSHLWMSGHTVVCRAGRGEETNTKVLRATWLFIRHRILHFTDLSMLWYCQIPHSLTFLTLRASLNVFFSPGLYTLCSSLIWSIHQSASQFIYNFSIFIIMFLGFFFNV